MCKKTETSFLTELPEELLELIIDQCNILVDNNITHKFPFTKYFEINLMTIITKELNAKYKLKYPTKGYYADFIKKNNQSCSIN